MSKIGICQECAMGVLLTYEQEVHNTFSKNITETRDVIYCSLMQSYMNREIKSCSSYIKKKDKDD